MSDVANVQVYVCPISRVPNNHLILSHYLSFLNAAEKLRYDQYHPHVARLFLISRVLMKSVLSDKLGILPHEVIIQFHLALTRYRHASIRTHGPFFQHRLLFLLFLSQQRQ